MATTTGPVQESNRLLSLDVARGFALLGIFLVNIALMAAPLGEFTRPQPVANESVISQTIYYSTKALFEGKTYPLFSLLFGIGLAMQFTKSKDPAGNRTGSRFYTRIVRRQIGLIVLGLLHIGLLWYGDILFIYGIVGLATLLVIHLRAKWIVLIAAICLVLATITGAGMGAYGVWAVEYNKQKTAQIADQQESTVDIPAESSADESGEDQLTQTPFEKLLAGFQDGSIQEPHSPGWMENEIIATRDGPFLQALGFRSIVWASSMFFMMLFAGGGLHIFVMFLIGVAIWKADLLGNGKEHLRRKLAFGFAAVGIPFSIYIAIFPAIHSGMSPYVIGCMPAANYVFGPLISLFYLFGFAALVDSGLLKPITNALANTGRLALTNYLCQTFLASVLFAFWGFGLFGSVDRPMRLVIVLSIFIGQIIFSKLWLTAFKIGPLEWFLRSFTYFRLPKLLREPAKSD
jgi:uncharacterized protein